jgi:nucleotide-binding universal stress UspA family protein
VPLAAPGETDMFSKVIVGVDGRAGGRDALALAKQLVSQDGKLAPAHVWFIDPTAPLWAPQAEQSTQRQRALQRLAAADGLDADSSPLTIADRSVGEGLHELALAHGADLIVIGGCRRGLIGRAVIGDDARSVLEHSPCPVAVAPAEYSAHRAALRKIGVAYDGSPESQAALTVARRLAAGCGARLSALEVVQVPVYVRTPWDVEDAVDRAVEEARERIAALGGVEAHAACGSEVEELARYGASVDLLVIGARGFGRIGRMLHPSRSERLARTATWPVLVVPRAPTASSVAGDLTTSPAILAAHARIAAEDR